MHPFAMAARSLTAGLLAAALTVLGAGDAMEARDWINYGLPTMLLVSLVWGLWRLIGYAKVMVVEPVVKAHLELIDTLKREVPEQKAQLAKVADMHAKVSGKQARQMEQLREAVVTNTEEGKRNTDVLKQSLDMQNQLMEDVLTIKRANNVLPPPPNHGATVTTIIQGPKED